MQAEDDGRLGVLDDLRRASVQPKVQQVLLLWEEVLLGRDHRRRVVEIHIGSRLNVAEDVLAVQRLGTDDALRAAHPFDPVREHGLGDDFEAHR